MNEHGTDQPPTRGVDFAHDVFISYSHDDAAIAAVIQERLEKRYRRLPATLRCLGKTLRVFRDTTDLTASPELWPSLEAKGSVNNNIYNIAIC